jgi:hypothetical protein
VDCAGLVRQLTRQSGPATNVTGSQQLNDTLTDQNGKGKRGPKNILRSSGAHRPARRQYIVSILFASHQGESALGGGGRSTDATKARLEQGFPSSYTLPNPGNVLVVCCEAIVGTESQYLHLTLLLQARHLRVVYLTKGSAPAESAHNGQSQFVQPRRRNVKQENERPVHNRLNCDSKSRGVFWADCRFANGMAAGLKGNCC